MTRRNTAEREGRVRVAFIHGRPGPHPAHAAFAKAVGADFYPVDPYLRWHDKETTGWYRYASWLLCSGHFVASRRAYDVILSERVHVTPVLIRALSVANPPKIIALLGDEMLYFLAKGLYNSRASKWITRLARSYDALLCIGDMQAQIARCIVAKPVFKVVNGVPEERTADLSSCAPDLGGRGVVLVANGPDGWRTEYKGLDLAIHAVRLCQRKCPDVSLTVVGEWDEKISSGWGGAGIRFIGSTKSLTNFFEEAAIYLQCGRGDAFPVSVLEAMAAGLIPIVSEWTGAKEAVQRIDPTLICPLDVEQISARVLAILALSPDRKQSLSDRARAVAREYSQASAIDSFKRAFNDCVAAISDRSSHGAQFRHQAHE